MSFQKIHQLFFWLVLIFLPTQLGFHFWPEWSMVLGRRVDYLSPTIFLTDLLILLTLIFWVLSNRSEFLIFNLKFLIKQKNSKFLIFKIIPATIFIGVNIFIAANHSIAVYKWLKVLEFGLFGFYVYKTKPKLPALPARFAESRRADGSIINFALTIAILYSSLIAISQFVLQHSIGGLFWWLGERAFNLDTSGIARVSLDQFGLLLRVYATFPHPNVFGGFLAVTLPLLINQQINKHMKYFLIPIIVLGIIALILTFSRSAIMVGFMGIGITLLSVKKINKLLVPTFLIGGLILFFLISKSFNLGEESIVVRQELNAAAIKIWSQSPIFGVGLGNFLNKLPDVIPTRTIYFLQPVHNIYLLILSEAGIVGLIAFIFLVWKSLITFKLSIPNYQLSIVMLLILGLVDHYPLTLQQGQLLFVLFLSLALRI